MKKLLFARMSRVSPHPVYAAVECRDKDHAIDRLLAKFPYTDRADWDYLEELDPESVMGPLGHDLPMEH